MKIGVIGAGLMGAEIALIFALKGYAVTLLDSQGAALDRALMRLTAILEKGVARNIYPTEAAQSTLGRIRATTDYADLSDCGFVTEAVFETLAVKTAVLQSLDAHCAPDCIIASNTSTLPISTLAACLSDRRRKLFLGTHYFSPVSRMALVEVISGFDTDPAVVNDVHVLLHEVGKIPVPIKDVAGFAVNRMLHAMMIEAIKLVEEGVASPKDLDTACRLGLGHPIGPFAMMDVVSSDLCLQVQDILHDAYGERFRPPALLKQRVAAGFGGGKHAKGWIDKD